VPETWSRSIAHRPEIIGWSWEEVDASLHARPGGETPVSRRRLGRAVKGIFSTLAIVVLGAVALLATFVAVSTRLSPDGRLGVLGHPVMMVLSGSMAPMIDAGDLVVDAGLSPSQAAGLRPGQVITFRAAGGTRPIFTHRITAVETAPGGGVAYRTKGDANDSQDGPAVPSNDVVGLYQWRIPYGGYAVNALHRPLVLILLLASPFLCLLFGWLWKWAGETDDLSAKGAQPW
jgi:signal peptidase